MGLPIKKYLSISICLSQILSSSFVSAADMRPRNHIVPLGNDALAPHMGTSANGRDVVNITNPDSDGISHNKYQSFDIAKDNGVILNNSQDNGVSLTGGYVSGNPNLSSNAKLIINEIFSSTSTTLNGTLEVFGKGADVIVANENGLVVNGASFINTTGVTLTTGFIDRFNKNISVRGGNISILNGGVGVDGNYFSIISESMQLLGNISKLDGNALDKIHLIAGLNDVGLKNDMANPLFEKNAHKSGEKPKFAIDGNMLGSMYAGYIRFVSTEDGVGVRHKGVIRSVSDIVISSSGDITTNALIAENVDIKTPQTLSNKGVIIADKELKIEAQTLSNAGDIDGEIAKKLGVSLESSYLQGGEVIAKFANLHNDGKIVGISNISMENPLAEFVNNGSIGASRLGIEVSSFANNGLISSLDFKLNATKATNSGKIEADSLEVKTKDFANDDSVVANVASFDVSDFKNNKSIEASVLNLNTQSLANTDKISSYNAKINAQKIQNSGSIESENELDVVLQGNSKSFSEVLDNQNGVFQSNHILSLKADSVEMGSAFGKFSANGRLLIESEGDILVKKTFSNTGSIGLKAKGNIQNDSRVLLASKEDIYLESKAFVNEVGGYVFGKNITIKSDNITNNEDATIDAQENLAIKATSLDNHIGVINSGADMEFFVKTLNNIGKTLGDLQFVDTRPGWLHYYFAKDYFGNRNFDASYTGYSLTNHLQNKQAIIKSGGNLKIGFEEGQKSDVYNNNSLIGASKNIDISGNVYNTTTQKSYKVEDLLKKFDIQSIEAKPTYAGNTAVYRLGSGNALEILDKAKYSNDDNAGYLGLLKDLASKNEWFKSLMDRGFGVDWLSKNNPKDLVLKTGENVYFTPKNPAQILAGNTINIEGNALYNSTGSVQKINADINEIKANLQNIVDFTSSTAKKVVPEEPKEKPKDESKTPKKEILESVGLSEEQILGLGNKLLFYTNSENLNSKVSYYIETRPDLVDMDKFFGSQYFFNQIGYAPSKPIAVIGDAYYENRLLNYQLSQNLGYSNALNSSDIKNFLDNAVIEQKNLGLVVGEALSEEQISKLDKDIVWYVNKKINGKDVLVPQLYYSKNTMLKKDSHAEGSNIASLGDMFINTGTLSNQASTLQAQGTLNIQAQDEVKNIGGVIAGDIVGIDAKKFLSEGQMGINESGDFSTISEAKITSQGNISIQAQDDIKIQNSEIISSGKDSAVNLISTQGSVNITDEKGRKTQYAQVSKKGADNSGTPDVFAPLWVSTTIVDTSFSLGSKIQADNINISAKKDIAIKGSYFAQTSKDGSINLLADGDVKILAGKKEEEIKNHSFFSGVNQKTGMPEYGTTTNTDQKEHQAIGSYLQALGNINITAKKDLMIEASGLSSDKKINLLSGGTIGILDAQNTSDVSSSYTSYQVLGIKGGTQMQNASLSSASFIKGGEGIFIDSTNTRIVGSDIESKKGDVIFTSKENLKIEAGKNTLHQEDTSYGFGIVGSANAAIVGNKAYGGFGINEGNIALAQSNFDSKTLSSGKIQMDSLASVDVGLEFSYNSQTTDGVHYANSTIKSGGNIEGLVGNVADIGGADLISDKDIILQAGAIETTKYVDTNATHSMGFNLSIKQKAQLTSSAVDTMNMIADTATKAASGKNLNAGVVAASAIGAGTNLIFNDLIGTVSTQEASFQVSYQDTHKTSENITKINANGNISLQSSSGDINLQGVAFKGDALHLESAKNIHISAAKNTNNEKSFSFGAQGRFQQSAGYSALWGSNASMGTGGNVNASYGQKNQISYESSSFDIKKEANIISKDDFTLIGGRINAGSANVEVGGNLHIASAVDSSDSKNFNASLGGDIALGGASNTIGKADLSLNGGGGYYYEDKKSVAIQSGILTQNALNVDVKGDANLQGAILASQNKIGALKVGKNLSISDINLHQNKGGGGVNLSGGLSGNFGGQINVGDFESEKSLLHSATNLAITTEGKISINGTQGSAKDVYTDIDKTRTILSGSSFVGGDISFSANVGQIKEIYSSLKKPHLSGASTDGTQPNEMSPQGHIVEQDGGFGQTLVSQHNQNAEQPDVAPTPTQSLASIETSDSGMTQAQQISASKNENVSLAKKIKNFFVKKKGSYDLGDLASEEVTLVAYEKPNENLPPKSEAVINEQNLIAFQEKHSKNLEKFAKMGDEVPPRVPLKQENKKSESDKADLEDFIDRGVFELQSLNISQSADVIGAIVENPVFLSNRKEESLKNYFVQLLSEVGEHFPYSPESREYKEMTKKIYAELDTRLKNDPKIEYYVRNFDSSKTKHYKKLTKKIVDHYTEAMKSVDLDVRPTGMHFSKKFDSGYYWAGNDGIHIPLKEAYKNAYFKNRNPSSEEFGLHIFDTVVHEMTHKQQDVFVRNIDNPDIPQTIKDYAFIMNLNRFYYAKAQHNYGLYRGQILELEAFTHGDNAAKDFKNFLDNRAQGLSQGGLSQGGLSQGGLSQGGGESGGQNASSGEQDLSQGGADNSGQSGTQNEGRRNPLVQRVLGIFNKP